MRALGFCASVEHAEYMADRFRAAGIPALAVSGAIAGTIAHGPCRCFASGRSTSCSRSTCSMRASMSRTSTLLLLLRPTQSATVFLQQLGRGLRRTPDKPVLTVLDFIGQQRREFRFDLKYRALTGTTRSGLERQLDHGFPFLPSGCELVLDSVARDVVLDNVRRQLTFNRRELIQEVRSHGDLSLEDWLRESGRELSDVLKRASWTALRRAAGLPVPPAGPAEESLLKRTASVVHVDDPERAEVYAQLLTGAVQLRRLGRTRAALCADAVLLSLAEERPVSYQAGFDLLLRHPAVVDELRQMIALGCRVPNM